MINKKLTKIINKSDYTFEDFYDFMYITNILNKEPITFIKSYNVKYTRKDIKKLAYLFLKNIDQKYANFLKDNYKLIKFDNRAKEPTITYNKNKIIMPYSNTIDDSYSIVHELFHLNNYKKDYTSTRDMFSEGISYSSENLLSDYIIKRSISNEKDNNFYNMISQLILSSISFDVQALILYYFEKKGYITNNDLNIILGNYNYSKRIYVLNLIKNIIKNGNLDIWDDEKYVIGILSSFIIYQKYLKTNDYKLFKYLNDNLNNISDSLFLSLLDIPFDKKEGTYTNKSGIYIKEIYDKQKEYIKKIR